MLLQGSRSSTPAEVPTHQRKVATPSVSSTKPPTLRTADANDVRAAVGPSTSDPGSGEDASGLKSIRLETTAFDSMPTRLIAVRVSHASPE